MPLIHVGTSGWNYPGGRGTWNGVFYPPTRPRGFDELAYYAEHFDAVEVNSTFYRMPEAPQTSRWLARTPPGFLFAIKLFQKFTHPDMYLARNGVTEWSPTRDDLDLFRAGVEPIAAAGRLAALLLQFPPSFHASPEARAYLDWLLDALTGYPVAVELRHRSWSDEAAETDARLAAHAAALVHIDEPKFADSITQNLMNPTNPVNPVPPVPLLYIRLHGRNAAEWWTHDRPEDWYNYLYAADELRPFAAAARDAAGRGTRALLFANNHFSAKAVANAAMLKHLLGQPVPGDYPAEMTRRYPELDGVVATSGLPL